ncbi:PAS domain S-box-containing protein [Rhizobium sp. RU20A]|uniref:PAS domain-containing protein n=1 Tax=Rhizobium sp. RU20A TaxID=1907412 RepID=UPI00095710BC|nr:PAS domain-containing protein [Rhizobium sp. RU20A]SIR29306.1 PAS domain S-box-containing protein [Rhizobium sp. RU20A]
MIEKMTPRQGARDAGDRLVADQASENPFAAAFKATRMPMLITDPHQADNPIIFCNRAFSDLTGYSREELVGRNCRLLQGEGTDMAAIARLRDAISEGRDISIDILNYRKDGAPFWNALFVSPVRDAEGTIRYFFASQLDFTNIKSKEAELARARHIAEEEVAERTADLTEALRAKTALVHEVDHRVKNNLLTIASILKLQARMTTDETVGRTLMSVLNRVEALSTVQRKLLNDEDVGHFDVADFAKTLIVDIVSALRRTDIVLTTDVHEVVVPATKASPLALIINELVGDAVRRGLSQSGGEIHLEVRRLNGHFLIRVADTVQPVTVDPEEEAFGFKMLEACCRQLRATMERRVTGDRTEVVVTLMVKD